jgi:hypothetical protein
MKSSLAFTATLLSSAHAFAPTSQSSRTSVSRNALIDDAFGVTNETGNKIPPLGRYILQDVNEDGEFGCDTNAVHVSYHSSHRFVYLIFQVSSGGRMLRLRMDALQWLQL